VLALACAGLAVLTGPRQARATAKKVELFPADAGVVRQIHRYQHETWRWQGLMGIRRTPSSRVFETDPSRSYKVWVRNLWRVRAIHARRHEGRWNDPNPPYYGGLQMDLSFQRRYGRDLLRRKGTADHWLPLEQIWVAEKARRSGRGFYPWPNTARACGLI